MRDGIGDTSDAVIVEDAETEEEAAQEAAERFDDEFPEDAKPIEHIFIAPWNRRVAYQVTVAVKRAEMQCCGGPAPAWVDPEGHWGGCPERPDRDPDSEDTADAPEPRLPSTT